MKKALSIPIRFYYILQRQLMEQKMRQKRQTTGMIQASDLRSKSAKMRTSSGRELHG